MDAVILARIQFAFTVGFHFLFPPLTIGLSWIIVWMLARYKRSGERFWRETARFWVRLFTLTFAIGVATGITMEFQFGTNWADYSRFVGDIFGAPLAAEALFSFFLESTFLGVLLFGWNRFSPRALWFAGLMVAIGSSMSALWIIIANSWMQTPAGYAIIDGRAVLTDFWAAALNVSVLPRYIHTMNAALTTGAFFVIGISSWFLLKKRHLEFARQSLRMGLVIGAVAVCGQALDGHASAVQVAYTQPEKLAAMEGLFETETGAGLLAFGWPDVEAQVTHASIKIPYALSLMMTGGLDYTARGLKEFPRDEWPPVLGTFASFHTMVGLWGIFVLLIAAGLFLWWRGRLYDTPLFHRAAVLAIPLPFIANEFGWMAAELGRQPWIVYKELKTVDAISRSVSAGEIVFSLVLFGLIYALLFALWIYLIRHQLHEGPALADKQEVTP
jgi:cytochrome d ubiquinol oxidase subunit I